MQLWDNVYFQPRAERRGWKCHNVSMARKQDLQAYQARWKSVEAL
jgi:hypothetical protein